MITASELKTNSVFKSGNDIFIVLKLQGTKSGRGAQVTKIRVKNLLTGQTSDLALTSSDKLEEIDLDEKNMNLSFIDGDNYVFMDNETYEQFEMSKEDLGDNAGYIAPDDNVAIQITFYEGKPIGVKLPIAVTRTIKYCEPGIKGDTSGKSLKPAVLDTDMTIGVPLFCEIGTKIKVDTRDGSFMERAK
jgi:elongation factor P